VSIKRYKITSTWRLLRSIWSKNISIRCT